MSTERRCVSVSFSSRATATVEVSPDASKDELREAVLALVDSGSVVFEAEYGDVDSHTIVSEDCGPNFCVYEDLAAAERKRR